MLYSAVTMSRATQHLNTRETPRETLSITAAGCCRWLKSYVPRHPLWSVVLAFTLLVGLHVAFTPVFEAPDEVWHYAYVRWLAEGYGLPSLTDDRSGAHQQAAQPPLYYLAAALIRHPFEDSNLDEVMWHNPGFGHQAPGTVPDNKNMLIHPQAEVWPWRGAVLAIRATRMASLAFGLITVLAAWALGYEMFRSQRWALVTASLVAFHPQFVFISSVINNDSAAAALSTTSLWLGARILMKGANWRRAALAGLLAGLTVLTKSSGLGIVPVLGLCLILAHRFARVQTSESLSIPRISASLALYSCVTLLVSGWWYARNILQTGTLLGLGSHIQTLWGRAEPARLDQYLSEVPLLLRSFWGAYGWGHVHWPDGIYVALWVIALICLVAGLRHLFNGWRISTNPLDVSSLGVVTVVGTVATLWLIAIGAALAHWMTLVEAPHGRLLFPALSAWALILALGLRSIASRHQRIGRLLTTVLLGLTAGLTTLAPGARILATFAPPLHRSNDAVLAACTHPTDIYYADKARLICANVRPSRVNRGELIEVEACWTALNPMVEDYTVFVHIIGPGEARVAERHTYPGLGRFPTSLWTEGEAFCDTYRTRLAPDAEAPLRYQVLVGLFDTATGARLAASSRDGSSREPPVVGEIQVASSHSAPVEPDTPATADFGDGIRLIGYSVPSTAEPGAEIGVKLYWSASVRPTRDYVAFVHLWQPYAAVPIAQHDAQPRDGWYPTSLWVAGDQVPDLHRLQIPETLPPGTYPLWAGLYGAEDGLRLPAEGPQGRFLHDLVPLGVLKIQ